MRYLEEDLAIERRRIPASRGRRTAGYLLLGLYVALIALAVVEFARVRSVQHTLADAAHVAARITVSNPLNAKGCSDAMPCPIESAARAAKTSLLKAGLNEASCLNSKRPSFSGILVWVFSCDGRTDCNTSDRAVCVKINMTAATIAPTGAIESYADVTVQYPHAWTVGPLLNLFPGAAARLPKSLSTSALLPD
jgi:hypothetical protein